MEYDSQSGGFPHDCGVISPSIDGVCQTGGDLSPREMILTMKSQSWGRVVGNGTCHPGITLHNSKESCMFSFFEFSKGGKEKRCIHNDTTGGDVPAEQDLTLVLGLGCTPGSLNSGGSLGLGSPLGAFCLEGGEQDGLRMDLGLSLKTFSGHELTNNCMTTSGGIVSSVTALSRSAVDSEIEGHQYGFLEIGAVRNAHLQLGSLLSSSQDLDRGGAGAEGSTVLISKSGESACGMNLQLGLSGTSVATESDCLSGTPLIKNAVDVQENMLDIMANEHIPLVDEGSTSARWMKTGGYMTSLLCGSHGRVNQTSNLRKSFLAVEDPTDSDIFTSRKESTVSASTCDAVGGFSGQTSKMTAATSSTGVLAGTSDRASKACKFQGCGKGARGASGLCIAHGGGQRCQRQNCNKGAEGRTMYCKAHGGGRRCQILGCIKSAEGKTDLCIGHGGGRRCCHEGCNKAARGKSGLCIRHGGGKRCQKEGCTKSAEGFSGLCISHGGGRRCQYPGCGKGAQGSTMFCKAHGGGRRCMYEGCTKGAEGSTPFCKAHGGGKRCMFGGGTCTKSVHGGTLFCVAHGGGKRCAEQGCSKSARGRTDHCVRHGGGKRCKFEDCSKSAQGSTDFCKAHGGGKRCSWCQEGSIYSGDNLIDKGIDYLKGHCDRFARGKAGLCAAHSALMQYHRVSGDDKPCSSPSKSTTHDSFQEPGAMSVHNGENLQALSDASEQPFQFSPVTGCEEQLSAQLCQSATASLEGSWRSAHQIGQSRNAAKMASRSCFASDMASQDIPFDECGTNIWSSRIRPRRCWLSLPQVCLRNKIAAALNETENAATKSISLADAQQAYVNSPNSVGLQDTGSSFFSSQKVVLPMIQKGDLLLPDRKQHAEYNLPNPVSHDISRVSRLAPEERVHGGGLMALLAKETTRHSDLQ